MKDELEMADFEVIRTLARGSFGLVYLVKDSEGKEAVIKKIPATDRQAVEQEVQLLATLNHPNIVGYKGAFVQNDPDEGESICILMEYCTQGDLFVHLQEESMHDENGNCIGSNIPEAKITEWLIQICWALDALHSRNILHRDLKTQNIFLTGDLRRKKFALKLGDFGVAKVLSSSIDLAQTQIGTPFYMAPEVFKNQPYSYASDFWGVGCVLYEMLTGNRAFNAQSLNGLALKVMKGKYSPIPTTCSPEMQTLVKSLFSRNSEHRPTLKEILCLPHVRKRLQQTLRGVVEGSSPHQAVRESVENLLKDQIVSMGMGSCIGVHSAQDEECKQTKQKKLEVMKTAREEQQRSLALLEQQSSELMATVMKRPRPSPPTMREEPAFATDRERVIYFREVKKQEDLKRFENEAKDIRDEARAARDVANRRRQFETGSSADMWNALGQIAPRQEEDENQNTGAHDPGGLGSPRPPPPQHRHQVSGYDPGYNMQEYDPGYNMQEYDPGYHKSEKMKPVAEEHPDFDPTPIGPQREVVRPVVSPASQRPLEPLLRYDHINEMNLQNPFSQINPKVVHTPITKVRPGNKNHNGNIRADGLAEQGEMTMDGMSPYPNRGALARYHSMPAIVGRNNDYNTNQTSEESTMECIPIKVDHNTEVYNLEGENEQPYTDYQNLQNGNGHTYNYHENRNDDNDDAYFAPVTARQENDWDAVTDDEDWSDDAYDKDYPGLQETLQAERVHKEIDRCQSAIAKQNMTLESLYFDLAPGEQSGMDSLDAPHNNMRPPVDQVESRNNSKTPDVDGQRLHPRYKELEAMCIKGLGTKLFQEALTAFQNGYPIDSMLGDLRGFVSIFEQMHHLDLR